MGVFDPTKVNLSAFDQVLLGNPEEDQQVSSTFRDAMKVDPDQYAKSASLSEKTGLPVGAVNTDPESVEQQSKFDDIDFEEIRQRNPVVYQKIQNYDFSVQAQNDLDSLSEAEDLLRPIGKYIAHVGTSFEKGSLTVESADIGKDRMWETLGYGDPVPDELLKRLEEIEKKFQGKLEEDYGFVAGIPMAAAEQLPILGDILKSGLIGATGIGLPSAAAGAAVAGPPGAIAAGVGGAKIGGRLGVAKAAFDLEAGSAYNEYVKLTDEDGNTLDPEIAAYAAMGVGVINASLESLSLAAFGRTVTPAMRRVIKRKLGDVVKKQSGREFMRELMGNYVKAVGTEAITESFQEFFTIAGGELAKLADKESFDEQDLEKALDKMTDEKAGERIAQAGEKGLQAAILLSGVTTTTSAVIQNRENQILHNDEQHKIDELARVSEATELRERNVEEFKQTIIEMDADQNTNVFIDGAQTKLYLQGKTPQEIETDPVLRSLNEQANEAALLGADVTIPVQDFMGDIVGTPHYEALRPHMTLSADTASPFRLETEREAAQDYVQSLIDTSEQNLQDMTQAQDIFLNVRDQLIDTGMLDNRTATLSAKLVPAWATSYARRNGVSVQEAYEQSGLVIKGPQTAKAEDVLAEAVFKQNPRTDKIQDARGYYSPSNSMIRLQEAADSSTFLHEFAHFVYEMELRGATDQIMNVNKWFKTNMTDVVKEASMEVAGILPEDVNNYLDNNGTGSKEKDNAIRMAVHEQFARGFETYLMEGKAPSIELRDAFRSFARWLTQIYRAIRGDLNVNLDNDMRKTFDRLLATEEEIAAAETRSRFEPMFTDAAMAGMSDKEFKDYQEQQQKVKDVQSETLRDKVIKTLTRQTEKWWKQEKQTIIDSEIERLSEERVYVARNALKTGDIKLDHAVTKQMVGEEVTDKRGRKSVRIPGKLNGMTKTGGEGLHPNDAAGMFGYKTGAELIDDLVNAPTIKVQAEANAQAEMIERHGDVLHDGSIQQEADIAVRNEERGKLILRELRAIGRMTRRPAIDRQSIKDIARERIGKLSFSEIHPHKYRKAEINAAKEAATALAEGNQDAAFDAKTRQVMNHYLTNEAMKAKMETENILNNVSRYSKKKIRNNIGKFEGGYLDQIDKILNRFEFRKSAPKEGVSAVETWAQNRNEKHGDAIVLSDYVVDETKVEHWKNVPFSELQGINDTLKNIEHVARYTNKIRIAEETIEFNKLVDDWTTHIGNRVTKKFRSDVTMKTLQGKGLVRQFVAQQTKVPWLASWLDGGERVGMSHDILMSGLNEAAKQKEVIWRNTAQVIIDALNARDGDTLNRHSQTYFIPEAVSSVNNGNFHGTQILAVALNTGNKSNLRKMLLGEGWADVNQPDSISIHNPKLQAVLSKMTKDDWILVQLIWKQMDSLYPMLADIHKKTTGQTPPKIEAIPVQTAFGEFTGGYYPMDYDSFRSPAAMNIEQQKETQAKSPFSNHMGLHAQVTAGSTNERNGFYGPINYNLDVIPNHFHDTIHYITHAEPVRQLNKIIKDERVVKTLTETFGIEEYEQLPIWLTDVANDARAAPMKNTVDRVFSRLRTGVTLGIMGFKVSTGLLQISGLFNTQAELGGTYTARAMRDVWSKGWKSAQEASEFAIANSNVMGHRIKTMDREMFDAVSSIKSTTIRFNDGDALYKKLINGMKKVDQARALKNLRIASMLPIAYIQYYGADLVSWHGAYAKKLEETGNEQKAFQYADWVVENIQGSGATKDLATMMRNQSRLMQTLTMFMTFFSSLWNATRDIAQTKYDWRVTTGKAALMFILPVMYEMFIRGELTGEEDEEERMGKLMTNIALYPMTGLPFVRDIAQGAIGDYGYNISPVASMLGRGVEATGNAIGNIYEGEEITVSQIKNMSKLLGAAMQVPGVNQTWLTGEAIENVLVDGEELTLDTFHDLAFGPEKD